MKLAALTWLGHVVRMNANEVVKRLYVHMSEGEGYVRVRLTVNEYYESDNRCSFVRAVRNDRTRKDGDSSALATPLRKVPRGGEEDVGFIYMI